MNPDQVSRNGTEPQRELVIIRRRMGAGQEEPHRGIWKIAYADFMTALMAFFLVMWLLNASDKQTIAAVASYFSPVKLTDRVTNPKGLHDMESGARGSENAPDESRAIDGSGEGDPRADGSFRQRYPEEMLFRDPYGVLEQLAGDIVVPAENELAAASRGEALRDPFDPEFRFLVARANASESRRQEKPQPAASRRPAPPDVGDDTATAAEALSSDPASSDTAEPSPPRSQESSEPAPRDEPAPQPAEKDVAEEILSVLREASLARIPNVEVVQTSDGILISLTDEFDFGMFAIASAEPRPELVVIMEKIAEVLKSYPGRLVVRGHTDGRPFRTQGYDNWRLSTARAHMAYFMLTRGGVDEHRFERIEGYADRSLKVAGEPEAAQNRRIEILLRSEAS